MFSSDEDIKKLPKETQKVMKKVLKRRDELETKSNLIWALVAIAESMDIFLSEKDNRTTGEQIEFLLGTLISLERKGFIKIK